MKINKALFLDRDNTVIYDIPYNKQPEKTSLVTGIEKVLLYAQKLDYLLIIISNQSGIGRGLITENDVINVNQQMLKLLDTFNICITDIYFCQHAPEDKCKCRKPLPTMLRQAAVDHNINLSESIMVGDKMSDIQTGIAAGCKSSIFIKGYHSINENNNLNYISVSNVKDIIQYI